MTTTAEAAPNSDRELVLTRIAEFEARQPTG